MDETPMNETTELIAGFPKAAWDKFLQPIPAKLVQKDPNKADYVKHQICTEMLNECFGQDGWQQEVVETWQKDEYKYKEEQKTGRAYAEALIRLTIVKPGSGASPAVRENIGSQVAGGDWSETRKGAVSEGLKRAASLFGWAANVYKTEAFGEWEQHNGDSQQGQETEPAKQEPKFNADGTPANKAAKDWLPRFEDMSKITDPVTFKRVMRDAFGGEAVRETARSKVDLGMQDEKIDGMTKETLRALYDCALDRHSADKEKVA